MPRGAWLSTWTNEEATRGRGVRTGGPSTQVKLGHGIGRRAVMGARWEWVVGGHRSWNRKRKESQRERSANALAWKSMERARLGMGPAGQKRVNDLRMAWIRA
mmetsp:Transcript_2377/g.15924  ORF Transcript_2377/g.15924 Transcript_2377/m.15924 type:complete len:103 (-) Transcript_2377:2968-3276(-)